jgi:hypothetical protein
VRIKDGGCIAAKGEEASIMMCRRKGGSYYCPEFVFIQSIGPVSRMIPLQGIAIEGCQLLTCEARQCSIQKATSTIGGGLTNFRCYATGVLFNFSTFRHERADCSRNPSLCSTRMGPGQIHVSLMTTSTMPNSSSAATTNTFQSVHLE